jgi:hypothetical protein
MNKKSVEIIGGGTVFHVRSHLALSAPAYGTTARLLEKLCLEHSDKLEVNLHLTKMANAGFGDLDTPDNIRNLVDRLIENPKTKIIFFNAAMVDYGGVIQWKYENGVISDTASGKYQPRLKTAEGLQQIKMFPLEKIISRIRSKRKDIFLVGFKTTCGEKMDARYIAGLRLLKQTSCNLVFVNDIKYRKQMVITPEESYYYADVTREEALKGLVEMAYLRSHLTFTRSTVVDAAPVPWESPEVPEALRQVVDYCIEKKAYKPFLGATVGHFACKLNDTEFLTSRRKTNFHVQCRHQAAQFD